MAPNNRAGITNVELIGMHPAETLPWMEDFHAPPYITMAHTFHAPRGWGIDHRVMNQYVLQYVVSGTAEYPVSGTHYVTGPGDLLFHRPGEPHSIRTVPGNPYICISIVFHFGAQPFPEERLFGDRHLLGRFDGHPVERMLTELVRLYQQPGLPAKLRCQGLLLQLLGEAASPREEPGSREKPSSLAKLVLVKNFIIDHYDEDIGHAHFEKVSGLTRNYIIRQFKLVFGMSPIQYLTWVRVQKAKELAIQTDLSAGEIARSVGYADVHTFGRMFKKKTGGSLTEFCSSLTTNYLNTKPRIAPPESLASESGD